MAIWNGSTARSVKQRRKEDANANADGIEEELRGQRARIGWIKLKVETNQAMGAGRRTE